MGKVIDFGDIRVEHRDLTLRIDGQLTACAHLHIILDENGQTVTCGECAKPLNPFWALLTLAERYDDARQVLLRLRQSPVAGSGEDLDLPTPA